MSNGFHYSLKAVLFACLVALPLTDGASAEGFVQHAISKNGLFRASLTSPAQAFPLHEMQRWNLRLVSRDGAAVTGARIEIAGGVLAHPHSLPTAPLVTEQAGEGRYLIEGVKFDRQGVWRLQLDIRIESRQDIVRFEIPVGAHVWADWHDGWSKDERAVLRSLWIGSLPKAAADPSNAVADIPAAADFGHRLFFDKRLSQNGEVACASCHLPELAFTDGRKLARGVGQTKRNAPTIIGSAHIPWLFWDGRKDSLWSQALGPFENAVEHGTTRATVVGFLRRDTGYRRRYRALFGAIPEAGDGRGIDRAFANMGKAIAAFERTIMPGPAKFDRYVEAILNDKKPAPADRFSLDEIAGLKVFISENQGQCIRCHNGPMFTDNQFHNIGSHIVGEKDSEQGRAVGVELALLDKTNCRSQFNDASKPGSAPACAELRFAKRHAEELLGAFKTPTLRFLGKTAPYMHAGQFQTLEDAIWQYRDVPRAIVGKTELQRLTMTNSQFFQIEDFLATLNGPIRAPAKYLKPPQ
jgi:cytochrome c peroxidase